MKSPTSLFASLISKQSACSLYWFLFFFFFFSPSQEQDFSDFKLIPLGLFLSLLRFLLIAALSFSMSFTPSNIVVSQLSECKVFLFICILSCKTRCMALLVHSTERDYNTTHCVTGLCTSKKNNMKIIGHTSN